MDQKRDILLINKDSGMRIAGGSMLKAGGYPVHAASNMRDALAKLASGSIGLIVCGLELDDILATDFIAYLKNDPLREAIPFVFYLHNQSRMDLTPEHALELGASDVILYPIPADEFMGRIRKLLSPAHTSLEATAPDKSDSFPESFLPEESTSGDASGTPESENVKTARLSIDGKLWSACRIINHTFHGAMVETRLRGKQGSTVSLRHDTPAGGLTATGRLMHILLGDHERPMGMGINFRTDPHWREIHKRLKATAEPVEAPGPAQPAAASPQKIALNKRIPPETPMGIEVSRNDALWMYGEITEFDGAGAVISTPVLGKSGETLHIRMALPGEQITFRGRIKVVTLNDFTMPAVMEIAFPEKSQWLDIVNRFTGKTPSEDKSQGS